MEPDVDYTGSNGFPVPANYDDEYSLGFKVNQDVVDNPIEPLEPAEPPAPVDLPPPIPPILPQPYPLQHPFDEGVDATSLIDNEVEPSNEIPSVERGGGGGGAEGGVGVGRLDNGNVAGSDAFTDWAIGTDLIDPNWSVQPPLVDAEEGKIGNSFSKKKKKPQKNKKRKKKLIKTNLRVIWSSFDLDLTTKQGCCCCCSATNHVTTFFFPLVWDSMFL